jgi:HK97 family phage major capsid protein
VIATPMTKSPNAIPLRPDYGSAKTDRLYAVPSQTQRTQPVDYLFSALAVLIRQHVIEEGKRSFFDVIKETYGDGEHGEKTRVVMSRLVTKAASIPADMTTSGWADTLIQTVIADLTESLLPISIYGKLSIYGDNFVLGKNGAVQLPARNTSATVSGAFIAAGSPIPVRQGLFLPITMTPKKLGVITTMTREILEHSTPSIAQVLKKAMIEDTGVAIDVLLVDAVAATAIRPAGLKAGVTRTNPTAGGNITSFVGDLRGLATSVITGTRGNLRAPVWIMNTGDALAAALLPTANGDFPFADQLSRGMLLGFPAILSMTCPADTVFLLDAADFVTVSGSTPEFDVADQVTLHMEDTSPAALFTSPGVFASPVKNFFQCDSVAVKMRWPMNWAMRRTGTVAWTDSVLWAP